mmetsp:Transcript_25000/g.58665  ORF Transcript_25000/g.58665 Transcript_25000/m.58665 type:complete len:891 (-) Transcript_25000:38-2710(-)
MDFDQTRLYYTHQQLQRNQEDQNDNDGDEGSRANVGDSGENSAENVNLDAVRRHFKEFLRHYRLGNSRYVYREKLLRLHRRLANHGNKEISAEADNVDGGNEMGNPDGASNNNRTNKMMNHKNMMLEINVAHLGEYDGSLLGYLRESPSMILPELENAAGMALDSLLYDLRKSSSSSTHMDTQNDEEINEDGGENNGNSNENRNTANGNGQTSSSDWSIQILLKGNLAITPLRQIQSQHINRLIKCPGIVISATPVQVRGVKLTVRCNRCMDTQCVDATEGPYGNIPLPQRCQGVDSKECGAYPYSIVADESIFSDRQKLKLQEAPEKVPTGEMPRSVMVAVEKGLVDKAPPGTRVNLFCIPTLFNGGGGMPGQKGGAGGVQKVYLRCVGMSKDHPSGEAARFTPAEEEAFGQFAKRRDAYEILTRSVAPSIQGSYTIDIKKALVCMIMGGTRKRLPDGMRLRGDINVLLLGDPSTAKSQFLKFVGKTSPVGIYTSGKGSSAAGLTASVVRNAAGEFYLEGGAMVLADGGIVCIDEFDKMRPQDRVAIHEAMEQQTISIAKAGITTVLNSRAAVLAAANPVFGRYDDFKSASENIDLMTTILSRFDMIFLVRDIREEERDLMICRHVMGVHIRGGAPDSNAPSGSGDGAGIRGLLSGLSGGGMDDGAGDRARSEAQNNSPEAIAESVMKIATTGQGELNVPSMKKYIQYCKSRCKPTLSEEAGQVLTSSYVKIRDDVRKATLQSQGEDAQATIPITVRQLEALVRISESLAKIRLDSEVRIEDVNEALRLFRVSTMAANSADQINGSGSKVGGSSILGAAGAGNREEFDRAQGFLRCRLTIGSMVNKQKLIEEGSGQGYNFMTMVRVLSAMAQRGELLERNQGRLLKRIK